MRHHPENISLFVDDSRDISCRAVRIRRIANGAIGITVTEDDLIVGFDARESFVVCIVVTFPVCYGDAQNLPLRALIREERFRSFNSDIDRAADKPERPISEESSG